MHGACVNARAYSRAQVIINLICVCVCMRVRICDLDFVFRGFRKGVMDGLTDGPTDPFIEMHSRI